MKGSASTPWPCMNSLQVSHYLIEVHGPTNYRRHRIHRRYISNDAGRRRITHIRLTLTSQAKYERVSKADFEFLGIYRQIEEKNRLVA